MTARAILLRELHRLRRHAKELQDQLDRMPRMLKAQQDKVSRQEDSLKEAQEHLKKLKVKLHDRETTLKTTHQQIAKHTKQMEESGGKKEYDALKSEIAADRKKTDELENEMLELMGEIETRTAELPAIEKAIKTAREEQGHQAQESQTRLAALEEQKKQAHAQLTELEIAMPEDMRQYYQRMVAAMGEEAMSAVNNRTCSTCYTEITHQMVNDLMSGRLVPCKACGRLLYLPE